MVSVKKEIKRVVLTYPNQKWCKEDVVTNWNLPPYTLCLLGTMIQDDYEVKIIDAQFYNMTKDQYQEEIRKFNPDVVGISILTSEYAPMMDIAADYIKEVNPEIIVLAGGVHVTTQHYNILKNKNIDYAIRGEGEYVFGDFLNYLAGKGEFPKKGVVFRDDAGKTVALPPDLIENLDDLPLPNFDLVDYLAYANTLNRHGVDNVQVYPFARIMSSRGCQYNCNFCQSKAIYGQRLRLRSAKNVFNELLFLKEKYGIKGFIFEDENPFGSKKRTRELLGLMKDRKLNLAWRSAGVILNAMDEGIFKLMAETGCEFIGVAIESGSPRVLKEIIGKPLNLKKVPELIRLAKKEGLFVASNFVIGFPGETWEEIRETLHYAETCGVDYCKIYLAQPLLGTRLYDQAKELNAIVGSHDQVGWRHGRIQTDEFTSQEMSILRVYEWDRINFRDPEKRKKTAEIMGVTEEKLNEIRKNTRKALTF